MSDLVSESFSEIQAKADVGDMASCEAMPNDDMHPYMTETGWGPPPVTQGYLARAMKRGDLPGVQFLLNDPDVIASLERGGMHDDLAHARSWRVEAEAFEAANGKGARLDLNHSFNRDILPLLRLNVRQYRALMADQKRSSELPVGGGSS